jgi:acetyl-CoA carboxylase biotin carboxyl carrier protein
MDIKDIEYILPHLKKNDVSEFEYSKDGVLVKVKRGVTLDPTALAAFDVHRAAMHTSAQLASSPASGAQPTAASSSAPLVDDSLVKVESPMVGTFYRRSSPEAEPFVREGDVVKKGQTLCIVEAMKLMNEIAAPCSGRIDKILLADGQVAEFGETLFLINPDN